MSEPWQYQIRINVSAELADAYRNARDIPALARIRDVLATHGASMMSQYDAFAGYVAEAEREGVENYPLYQWTRDTLAKPEKVSKYRRVFTVHVDGREVYDRAVADALQAALSQLGADAGIERVTMLDTNPANNPQPPRR